MDNIKEKTKMKQMKKFILFSLFCALILMCTVFAFISGENISALAETKKLTLVTTSPSTMQNCEFSVEVYIEENSGVAGTSFTLQYDTRLANVVKEKCVLGNTGAVVNITEENISVSYASTMETNQKLIFVTLVFSLNADVSDGIYSDWLTLSDCEFFDVSFNNIDYEYTASVLTVSTRKVGDVYNDGTINSKDAIYLLQYLAKMVALDDAGKICANTFVSDNVADGTPKINTKDAIMLLQYLAKMDVAMGVGEWKVATAPTADAEGSLVRQVASGLENFVLPVLNEEDYDYTVVKEATCKTEGEEKYVYRKDGADFEFKKSIAKTDVHTPGEWTVAKAAACTETGVEHILCSVCGKELETKQIDALGHDYSETWTVDVKPTCTTAGSQSHHCVRCNDRKDVTELSALGHNYGDWELTTKPTFNRTGTLTKKCANDPSHRETFTLPILDKIEYDYTNLSESTCTQNGQDQYIYFKDGKEFVIIVTLEKKAHTPVPVAGKSATCTEAGLTEGENCSECGAVIVRQTSIPALGHDFTTAECSRCKTIQDGYTAISDKTGLLNIESNMKGKYVLIADISLSGSWTPLGKNINTSFAGVFDGNNHTISGIAASNTNYGGLFYNNAGTIKNLNLSNISFTMEYFEDLSNEWPVYGNLSANFGGIAATNSGKISSCSVSGKITISTSHTIKLYFTWQASAQTDLHYYNSYNLGGIVAVNQGTVEGCIVTADFSYSSTNTLGMGFGALGGFNTNYVTYLHSTVSVGGIVGVNQRIVTNCSMRGKCTLNSNQTADAYKIGSSRRYVNLNFDCNFGSVIGDNQSNASNCTGTICTINRNHQEIGDTGYTTLNATIRNSINSGIIGRNSGSGKATNCSVYGT